MIGRLKSIEWQALTYRIAMQARKDRDVIGSASVDFLMYSGYASLAHHWLIMEEKVRSLLRSSVPLSERVHHSRSRARTLVCLLLLMQASELLSNPAAAQEEPGFYQAKVETSEFVFEHLLPRTNTLRQTMMAPVKTLLQMSPERFSYDHSLE